MKRSFAIVAISSVVGAATAASACFAPGAQASAAAPSGLGWSAVIHHPTSDSDHKARLRMVSPTGGAMTIGSLSDDAQLADVSPDGRRVATVRYNYGQGTSDKTMFALWNTKTRKVSYLRLGGTGYWDISYTSDGGLLTANLAMGLAYKRTATGKATATFRFTKGDNATSWVSPDGARWVVGDGKKIQVRSALTGAVQKTYTNPPGRYCYAVSQWTPTSFVAQCDDMKSSSTRAFEIGYSESAAAKPLAPNGYVGVQHTSPIVGSTLTGGGATPVQVLTASAAKSLPGGSPAGVGVGGYGSRAWVLRPVTAQKDALYTVNPATGKWTLLAGGSKGGLVTDVRVIDGHN